MKQISLILFILTTWISLSQAPITQYLNTATTEYAIVTSSPTIDESVTGNNLVWNFTDLNQIGLNTDTSASPTTQQQTDFPGTTEVLTVTSNADPPGINTIFVRNDAEISITGITQDNTELTLVFDNNATLGTFPLDFNFSNTDTVSGSFSATVNGTPANGTFTGTFDTNVNASGTLNLNDFGLGTYTGDVTRLTTELNISLTILGVINIGTVEQIVNFYYDDNDGSLVFRSSTNIFDIDALGNTFNDTITTLEAMDRSTLSVNENEFISNISLYPNPTSDILNIESSNIKSIEILDLNGRIIVNQKRNLNTIDVSTLKTGIYIVNIETTNGNFIEKFIKE